MYLSLLCPLFILDEKKREGAERYRGCDGLRDLPKIGTVCDLWGHEVEIYCLDHGERWSRQQNN